MASPFQNIYNIRRVAETDNKPCSICYKPTTVYLVTACQKDFFPVCLGHLTDRGFATPIVRGPPPVSVEELEKRRNEALEKEIELVKKEYEEKQKRKKEKENEKEKEKEKEKSKEEKDKKDEGDQSKDTKERAKQVVDRNDSLSELKKDEDPKVFALHRDFYNIRLQRLRQQQSAKRTRDLLKTPGAFPVVPKGPIG